MKHLPKLNGSPFLIFMSVHTLATLTRKKSAEEGLIEVVREKEEQIAQLMDEG